MAPPRFYITPENWTTNAPVLAGTEAHHARDVLRLRAGDQAILFDGRGHELSAEVSEIGRQEMRFLVVQEREAPPRACRITLAQAIPKGKNMDLIVQKSAELGAAEIVPIISERTVVSLDKKEAASKQAKWQQTVIEACKQCGQNWMPEVREPIALKQLFNGKSSATPYPSPLIRARPGGSPATQAQVTIHPAAAQPHVFLRGEGTKPDLSLIASTRDDSLHLREVLRRFEAKHEARPARVTILIGPEGDFTPAEYANASEAGFQAITLGSIILRVETAAIFCLSVLSYELLGKED